MSFTEKTAEAVAHPLEPLSAEEISAAAGILRKEQDLGETHRFVSLALREPEKQRVLDFENGGEIEREAFAILLDRSDGKTYEAVVSLTEGAVKSWEDVPGVQPQVILDEFFECEQVVKESPEVQEALRKRGVTEFDGVMVDPWSAGHYGDEEEGRLLRALIWVKIGGPDDNGYAHPVENLIVYVDMNRGRVVRIEDHGVIPVPQTPANYVPEEVGQMRTDLKPVEITQPEGVSFRVNGHEVRWQKWRFRVGFTPREGLVLHTVGYEDDGRLRPILYRASLSEMVVPYGDPAPTHSRKNAFDAGEYNIGQLANSLELGCDCLGEIRYFDATLADSSGEPYAIKNAVCMHEEDYGLLWKHTDFRTERTEVRRSRRLVISFVATVGNYEYGFFWYLYQDGNIEFEAKLTGIMSTGAVEPGEKPKYGQLLDKDGLYAPIHQHFFSMRLDMDVDGRENSVYEVNTESAPPGPENPLGNAFFTRSTLLGRESEAQRVVDPFSARYWKVVNPSVENAAGEPVGYKLIPHGNVLPFAQPDSSVLRRAGFMTKHLWVTPYEPSEMHAAGDYPNQHQGGEGLARWTAADRQTEDTDVVVWYTFGSHHAARLEDWPVMPVQYAGFMLQPVGFFDQSPALDVPPSSHNGHCDH
ncbi:MAG TPA: primary-amine oxidase [Rubrobacteraceae bacterium]|nr:primary-amine oxidase [Rubrobacteraceae bacterium]